MLKAEKAKRFFDSVSPYDDDLFYTMLSRVAKLVKTVYYTDFYKFIDDSILSIENAPYGCFSSVE